MTLCITCKGYIPETDREQALPKLVCDTIQSLTTETHTAAVPEDQVRLALKKGVLDKAETFARFLWANTISWQRSSVGKGSFPASKLLIDVYRGCGILYNDQLKKYFSDPASLRHSEKAAADTGTGLHELEDEQIPLYTLLIRGYRSPLQMAAESGHESIVRQLLDAKADVNTGPAEYLGRTAF